MKIMSLLPGMALLACVGSVLGACATADKSVDERECQEWVTEPGDVLIIADNQFHNQYGDPYFYGTMFTDKRFPVSVRPPQLDLFAPDLLSYILDRRAGGQLVLHLGDALNIASDWEWLLFVNVMSRSGGSWYMAPGNHDVFYSGLGGGKVEPGEPEGGRNAWSEAADTRGNGTYCPPQSRPMTKDRWIRKYIQAVGPPAIRVEDSPDRQGGRTFEWASSGGARGLSRVAWHIESGDDYWRSWILQEIRIDNTGSGPRYVYLVDTCNYDERPTPASWLWSWFGGKRNAGLAGEVGCRQATKLLEWLDKIGGAPFLLAGHHPVGSLTTSGRERMQVFTGVPGYSGIITAHTHNPVDYKPYSSEWMETNIGSTTDSPPQFGLIRAGTDEVVRVTDVANHVRREVRELGVDWDEGVNYLSYRGGFFGWLFSWRSATQRNVLGIVQETYVRMFKELGMEPLDEAARELVHQAESVGPPTTSENKDGEWSAVNAVELLKELRKVDEEVASKAAPGAWKHRQLYGAWRAVSASIAEGVR